MKIKRALLAVSFLALMGAALWVVNRKLDHPPLSEADREFRALVAGADSMQANQMSCGCHLAVACAAEAPIHFKPLNAAQTRELIERLRFARVASTLNTSISQDNVTLDLEFRRKGKKPLDFTLIQTPSHSELTQVNAAGALASYQLHPRFEKSLRLYLNQVLPQRVRP